MSLLTVIRNASVYAPEPLGRQDILIGGGKILQIAPDIDIKASFDIEEIDGAGHVATPGFVDSLVHFSGGGGEGGFSSRTQPLLPETALAAGVTTMIGALGTDDITRSHADLLATARAYQAHGLSAYALTGSYRVPVRTLTGSVRDDLTLIGDFIGVGEIAIADHRGSQPTVDEMSRLAADARVGALLSGKRGTILVHVGDDEEGLALLHLATDRHPASRAQWHPTHINRRRPLLEQGIAWALAGGSVDLTTSTTPEILAEGEVPAAEALAALLAAGVPSGRITMSSDGQASLPRFDAQGRLLDSGVAAVGSLHEAVHEAVRRFGVPLEQALMSVTSAPAAIWGLPGKGRLAAGADADVLLLDPDSFFPLMTIAMGAMRRKREDVGGKTKR
jgi:beta-aspartyl-dipeptidase (metallo-type)